MLAAKAVNGRNIVWRLVRKSNRFGNNDPPASAQKSGMEDDRDLSPDPAGANLSYSSYLRLDQLLACQSPLSPSHEEPLFIAIHQTSELWLKLCLHELEAARSSLMIDEVHLANRMISRVSKIFELLNNSWDVLTTLTVVDYVKIRPYLGNSSGLQSIQYRLIESIMGNKNIDERHTNKLNRNEKHSLFESMSKSTIYDESLKLLSRRGLSIPKIVLDRDPFYNHEPSEEVELAWKAVYKSSDKSRDCYLIAETLSELEYRVHLWRIGHLKTIERIIGNKMGTGGTSGVSYLANVTKHVFFPEIASVRGLL
jgi:tryptophan 2,3-dioxygenase